MALIRLLLIALAIWLFIYFVRRYLAEKKVSRQNNKAVGQMVRCAYCQLHIPRSEALQDGDDFYCSDEHRRLAHQQRK